ncbi:MAG: IS1 family transposase [Bacteroidetes bacterium]|nr:IS1 family transposase [Bacteroidota bacterium]
MKNLCKACQGELIKAGKQKNGTQRYVCKQCRKYQQLDYKNNACQVGTSSLVNIYLEGCGIISLGRIFGISPSTVLNKIKQATNQVKKPVKFPPYQSYEIDEMHTFVGQKDRQIWITYAMERTSKQVVDFVVGSRNKENLAHVVNSILANNPKRIYTDHLNIYPTLIPKGVHRPSRFMTNSIERLNLTLRTHLKRLSRKTICYSRSKHLLEASLQLYFWQ